MHHFGVFERSKHVHQSHLLLKARFFFFFLLSSLSEVFKRRATHMLLLSLLFNCGDGHMVFRPSHLAAFPPAVPPLPTFFSPSSQFPFLRRRRDNLHWPFTLAIAYLNQLAPS